MSKEINSDSAIYNKSGGLGDQEISQIIQDDLSDPASPLANIVKDGHLTASLLTDGLKIVDGKIAIDIESLPPLP